MRFPWTFPSLASLMLLALQGCDLQSGDGAEVPQPPISSHSELLLFFEEWRAFQAPEFTNGVPDYSPETMARQHEALPEYQARLAAADSSGWSVPEQVDLHLVRAEMNGLDFDHRVMRPWSRMPSFYKVVLPSQTDVPAREGQVMHGAIELWQYVPPLDPERERELAQRLAAIPAILDHARENLVEEAHDLWYLGIRVKEGEARALAAFAEAATDHHPELAMRAREAREAVEDFRNWLEDELPSRTGPSGIGVEAYDWHLRHVQLVPYTWGEQVTLVRRQLERAWGFLALAENRNRDRPALSMVESQEEYQTKYREAVADFISFLEEEGIFTLQGFEEDALLAREGSHQPATAGLREFFTQVNYRDLRPMRTHGTHWFDLARLEADPHPSPIRQAPVLYNIWASRAEGLATGFEEWMAEAGFLEDSQLRELVWVLLAQRAARALGELEMHANRMTLDEAAEFIVENTPYDWLTLEGGTVWREGQLYLEQPTYGTSYVMGKLHLDRLLADRRRQLGTAFSFRDFMDDFHAVGLIPLSLIRWEMTGLDDEIRKLDTGSAEGG